MLLSSLHCASIDDDWLYGARFVEPPSTPIEVCIIPGYEKADLMDYFGTPQIMSDKFHQVLVNAGVDNLDVYNAILTSENSKIQYRGFKAFNVIGLVSATDFKKTVFSSHNKSLSIDASIDRLAIDSTKAAGRLLFRLAEYSGAIIVSEVLKQALEKHNFLHIVFTDPKDFIS